MVSFRQSYVNQDNLGVISETVTLCHRIVAVADGLVG